MKTVKVIYFKPSGKYYTEEAVEVPENITTYEAMFKVLPTMHRIKEMKMLIMDGDDGKEPYIVPHLFAQKE